jgi:hypothetical protein
VDVCDEKDLLLGNILEQPLEDIFHGERRQDALCKLENQEAICGVCDPQNIYVNQLFESIK